MSKFEQFCKERTYLNNVSPRTIEWHKQSLKWLGIEAPTEDDCKAAVIRMRDAGLKASSVNCRLRSINAYLKWSGSSIKIPKLKEPEKILPTFSKADIGKFMSWKPKSFTDRRLQVLVLLLADTGVRISEALGLKWEEVDMDSLLLLVHGKGGKSRRIPFSIELRRYLFRFKHEHQRVFCSSQGTALARANVFRDTKALCAELGIKSPERLLHSFRHSFSIQYLRNGGNVFFLQRCLGHSSLDMTKRYCNVLTDDLSAVHQKVSLLS